MTTTQLVTTEDMARTKAEPGLRTFIDLFAGIGGFHHAAAQAGLTGVFAAEIDAHTAQDYHAATGLEPVGDITAINPDDVPDHDLLTAGFPCQPYSIIGDRQGMDDPRGQVIHHIFHILEAKQPQAFVLENVKQLRSHDQGRTLKGITDRLQQAGYAVAYSVLNALQHNLPQRRERLFIVGFNTNQAAGAAFHTFHWPEPRPLTRTLQEVLLPAEQVPDHVQLNPAMRARYQAAHQSEYDPGIWHQNKGGCISSHPYSCALRSEASFNYLLVNGERRLAEREMLRLQGFPDAMELSGSYTKIKHQCGNAVPVPLAHAVIQEVINGINSTARPS